MIPSRACGQYLDYNFAAAIAFKFESKERTKWGSSHLANVSMDQSQAIRERLGVPGHGVAKYLVRLTSCGV